MVGLVGEQADVSGCIGHQDKQLWPVDQELGCQHIDIVKVLHSSKLAPWELRILGRHLDVLIPVLEEVVQTA